METDRCPGRMEGEEVNQYEAVKIFGDRKVRTSWNDEEEKWYFSVVDVIGVLSGSDNPRRYWSDLKRKISEESGELYGKIVQLKMTADDGKQRLTDVADTEQLLRIIQSIPSPNAEPFKRWLARVGAERVDEISDPEQAINRALLTYRRKGYSESWINQRLKSIEIRKQLTDEWDRVGVEDGKEYAILTDDIYRGWSGLASKDYKKLKGLKKENLRDNMTNMELVLSMLAEATTAELSQAKNPKGFDESRDIAKKGGAIVGNTRREIESQTGKKVVTSRRTGNLRELKEDENPVSPEEWRKK